VRGTGRSNAEGIRAEVKERSEEEVSQRQREAGCLCIWGYEENRVEAEGEEIDAKAEGDREVPEVYREV
jgi:hypothetical protein